MAEATPTNPKPAAPKKPAQALAPKATAAGRTQGEPLAPFDYAEVFSMATANFDALVSASEVWLRGLAEINKELVQFADARVHAVNETARTLAQADDAGAIADASLDHARSAAEVYFAETAKVVNLTTELARDSWQPLQECWSNGLNHKPAGK